MMYLSIKTKEDTEFTHHVSLVFFYALNITYQLLATLKLWHFVTRL